MWNPCPLHGQVDLSTVSPGESSRVCVCLNKVFSVASLAHKFWLKVDILYRILEMTQIVFRMEIGVPCVLTGFWYGGFDLDLGFVSAFLQTLLVLTRGSAESWCIKEVFSVLFTFDNRPSLWIKESLSQCSCLAPRIRALLPTTQLLLVWLCWAGCVCPVLLRLI